ncbi:hypothetical protein D3C76_397530 [compost metagenome]
MLAVLHGRDEQQFVYRDAKQLQLPATQGAALIGGVGVFGTQAMQRARAGGAEVAFAGSDTGLHTKLVTPGVDSQLLQRGFVCSVEDLVKVLLVAPTQVQRPTLVDEACQRQPRDGPDVLAAVLQAAEPRGVGRAFEIVQGRFEQAAVLRGTLGHNLAPLMRHGRAPGHPLWLLHSGGLINVLRLGYRGVDVELFLQ